MTTTYVVSPTRERAVVYINALLQDTECYLILTNLPVTSFLGREFKSDDTVVYLDDWETGKYAKDVAFYLDQKMTHLEITDTQLIELLQSLVEVRDSTRILREEL